VCGRYVVAGQQELSERFQLRQIPLHLMPTFNAAPSQQLPVVVEETDGARALRLLRWGLVPRWRKPGQSNTPTPINARSETIIEKPMFRGLVKGHRCLVPASGFYEWQRQNGKQPFYITLRDEPLFAFAGLYDDPPSDDEPGSFTILTTEANALVAPLHDRMPVILRRDDEATWLDPDLTDPEEITHLLRPYPAAPMVAYPVSKAVNNVRNNSPELIARLEAAARQN
jgi:putative SOS response-associated peptidase YedK